ncbi:MAG: hypothetical protein AB8H86_02950 [Polyangiales bacterium]
MTLMSCGASTGLYEDASGEGDAGLFDAGLDLPRIDVGPLRDAGPDVQEDDSGVDAFLSDAGLDAPIIDAGPDTPDVCVAELCNGIDDDCDGFIDDGLFCFSLNGAPIEAAARNGCGPEWYSYGVPDAESANPTPDIRVSDEAVLTVQAGPGGCGAYVAVITDLPGDGSRGALNGTFQITEGIAAAVAVGDEPRECVFDAARGLAECEWVWQSCCTDGVLLGPFRDDFCMTVRLSDPEGLSRVYALDGPARQVPLVFGETVELCGQFEPER